MAIDLAAKLAELRALKAKQAAQSAEITNAQSQVQEIKEAVIAAPVSIVQTQKASDNQEASNQTSGTVVSAAPETKPVQAIGTSRTSEIDHLAFMEKMGELKDALLTQHPRMPVLLMTIHKQLRDDPELVGTLDEDEIGTIVNSLKVQTKVELAGTIVKQSKSRDKKVKLDVDML